MNEIPGYPGYHLTTEFEIIGRKGNPLSKCCNQVGHQYVNVYLRDLRKNSILYLHRAIALVHVPGYFEGAVVDHIDRNTKNNHPSNLRWVTYEMNNYNRETPTIEKRIKFLRDRINTYQLELNHLESIHNKFQTPFI